MKVIFPELKHDKNKQGEFVTLAEIVAALDISCAFGKMKLNGFLVLQAVQEIKLIKDGG